MNDAKKESTKLNILFKAATVCCFVAMIIYFIYGIIVSPSLKLFYEPANVYSENWVRVNEDGSTETAKMPMTLHLEKGETATFYTILPDAVDSGMYLSINTGKSFTMYIDNKEIYRFDNRVSKLPGNITKTVISPVPLDESFAGQKLTLELTNDLYERNIVNAAFIGSSMGIFILLVKEYALQFVLAMLLLVAALFTIGIFLYIEKRDNRRAPLVNLAEGIMLICLWIVFDSPLFQFAFGVYFLDGIMGFMLVTIMAYPFMLYFDAIMGHRKHFIYDLCEKIAVINFIVFTFLHLTGIRSFDRSLIYLDVMLLVYIFMIFVTVLQDYFSRKETIHRSVVVGMIGLGIFSIFEIAVTILYQFVPFEVDIGGLFVLLGMIILLFFAILDQVKVFEALTNETKNAIAATKAKSDFLANMSHEIRTPINAIMGMNEMILRECEQESVKEYAKDINSASENLLEIINDILDFSKIESGKLELVCDNYDLGELIYDVTTLVNMKAEDKGLKFNIDVDENLPAVLYGDDKRVREIVTNILNNAVKYTEKGFVTLSVNGAISDKNVLLDIRVKDSGQGIRKEDLKSIFEGFSQANTKKNRNIEGTGLGLTITKRLVSLMEGTISVESEFGKGSVFTVSLPQQIVSDEKMGNYMNHRHVSAKEKGAKLQEIEIPDAKILVVDDTALNLKVISKLLSKTKANVICATSGKEMLELIETDYFDMILLDHMMPNMDGIEALQISKTMEKNKCREVPVIALTANAIVGAREMYLDAGFDDYLSKPVRIDELCEILTEYIPVSKKKY